MTPQLCCGSIMAVDPEPYQYGAHQQIKPNMRFGRLVTVRVCEIRKYANGCNAKIWLCKCDCGGESRSSAPSLSSGETKSCGCLQRESVIKRNWKHGLSKEPEQQVWSRMVDRCHNCRATQYRHYGGRGITVCDRWRHSFAAFYADMGPRPSPKHSIDRINNDGNYEPGNCRWATRSEQTNNTRRTVFITIGGVTKPRSAWVRGSGVSLSTFRSRIARGMTPEQALTTPVRGMNQ